MNTIFYQKDITINDDYDILVIGGGPAGCSAAIAAAREGKKTLLIDANGALGGMGTLGLVPAWTPYYSDKTGRLIYGGLSEKIFNLSKEHQPHMSSKQLDWVTIDSEALKIIYETLVFEAGADIAFFTSYIDVKVDDGSIQYVICNTPSGLYAYKAKVYIDCTGNGDLAVNAGAEYRKGNDSGNLQPATLCFKISGVDTYHFNCMYLNKDAKSIYKEIALDEAFPLIKDTFLNNTKLTSSGVLTCNVGHICNVDATDRNSISNSMVIGRKLVQQILSAFKKYLPEAFAGAVISSTGTLMGIRETRRIIGDYVLTKNDYFNQTNFEDSIGRNAYYIDIHVAKDEIKEKIESEINETNRYKRYEKGESHSIPYRCLTPKHIQNLLIAGRCISTDRITNGSIRVMPVCLVTGEAAGCAAALTTQLESCDVHKLDIKVLQDKLTSYGGYL